MNEVLNIWSKTNFPMNVAKSEVILHCLKRRQLSLQVYI